MVYTTSRRTCSTPPENGETAPKFETLLCDGEVFEGTHINDVLGERSCVLYFYGFVYSAIARHWCKRFDRANCDEFDDVNIIGVSRDGPFAQNEFFQQSDSPFSVYEDSGGYITDEFSRRIERDGMAQSHDAKAVGIRP